MRRDEEAGASAARRSRKPDEEVDSASFVKRSDIALTWRRGGSIMWTSGWGHCGSWIEATVAAASTMTGMSCVIVVSRSRGKKPAAFGSPKDSFALESSGKGALSWFRVVVVMEVGGREDVRLLVIIVSERRGTLSFFVRRIEADEASSAERRARWRGANGIRRLMVLFSTADWIVYVSKMVSYKNGQHNLHLGGHDRKLTIARTLSKELGIEPAKSKDA